MKNFGRLLLLFVALAAFLLMVAPLEAEIVQKCINKADGFSIEFPAGWQLRENPEDGVSLIAFRPKEKAVESVYERMEIASLEDAGEDSDAFLQKHIADLETSLPDFTLVSGGSEELSGLPSRFLVYTFADHFFTLKVLAKAKQWIVQRDGRTYLITGKATVVSFPQYEEIFRKIAGSFQCLK